MSSSLNNNHTYLSKYTLSNFDGILTLGRYTPRRNLLNEFNMVYYKKNHHIPTIVQTDSDENIINNFDFLKDTRRPQLHVMPDATDE